MKAIGIVGSPRKNGNTGILTKYTLEVRGDEEGLTTAWNFGKISLFW